MFRRRVKSSWKGLNHLRIINFIFYFLIVIESGVETT